MSLLTSHSIRLRARVSTKEEAIRAVGRVLLDAGSIESAYVESMLGREQQANTYLGHGIAIPHGQIQDRELIRRTGVGVVQVPEGVEWAPGQTVRLVIGLAARSDEHLGLLAALTQVLDEPTTADRLACTDDPEDIIAALTGRVSKAAMTPAETWTGARSMEARLPPGAGLHARPAANFVAVAGRFACEIRVEFNGNVVDGKAMASLLKLGAPGGGRHFSSAREVRGRRRPS